MSSFIAILVGLSGVAAILIVSEILWQAKLLSGEAARKFVHILVGSFVAFWPYFMSWKQIQFMSLAFLVVVMLSMQKHIFHAVHDVNRRTWGELFFPIGIGLSALIMPAPIVFTAAILHLSLADGLAAVVGKKYGKLHQYKIGNYTKTLAGSLTFLLVSLVIVTTTVFIGGSQVSWPLIPLLVWLPLAATALENLAIAGTDNLFVPLLIIAVLQAAKIS
jgi:phytol kinase